MQFCSTSTYLYMMMSTAVSVCMKAVNIVYLLLLLIGCPCCNGKGEEEVICRESEKEALLELKRGLIDVSGRLSSWDANTNCCDAWEGVFCDSLTAHVLFLQLQNGHYESDVTALRGTISSAAIANLTSLVALDLSYNQLEGRVPKALGSLCNLTDIRLSGNKFWGEVSEMLQTLSGCLSDGFSPLTVLDLSGNQLNGSLPESLGQLSRLQKLSVSDNELEGVVSEVHFANLANLKELYASGNRGLVLNVSPDWIPPFQCDTIRMRSWKVGDEFPSWLRTQTHLSYLDLSSAGISNTIPHWFWNLSSGLNFLNLSHNQFHGWIPHFLNASYSLAVIDLSSNNFSGLLPPFFSQIMELYLSNNSFSGDVSHFLCGHKDQPDKRMLNLHLEENLLSGQIPDCWMNWPHLTVVKLEGNNFTGSVPSSIGFLDRLLSLHLRKNSLSGEIPESLRNCTSLEVLDLSDNQFVGTIPEWMGERLLNLRVFSCSSNKLRGQIPPQLCALTSLQILDLSNNHLAGPIPPCIHNFTAMTSATPDPSLSGAMAFDYLGDPPLEKEFVVTKGGEREYSTILAFVTFIYLSNNNIYREIPAELTSLLGLRFLNLFGNQLQGGIPKKIGEMMLLESVDLSRNRLSGEIPSSMTRLNFLSYLNLSSNNLTGKIPLSTQLQSFNESCFTGNNLCGPPLQQNCTSNISVTVTNDDDAEGGGDWYFYFYITAAFGFVIGFWGGFGPLIFHQPWRRIYFVFLDDTWKKLYTLWIRIRVFVH